MIASRYAFFISPLARFCLLLTAFAITVSMGWAEEPLSKNATISTPHATVSLISEYEAITPQQEFWIGLHF